MADGKVMVLRVPREKIVRAAKLALRRTRRHQEVPRSTSLALLQVAREEPEFVVGGWWIDKRCGCLVGNLLGGEPKHESLPDEDPLWKVGVEFDRVLRGSLTPSQRQRERSHPYVVAKVTG